MTFWDNRLCRAWQGVLTLCLQKLPGTQLSPCSQSTCRFAAHAAQLSIIVRLFHLFPIVSFNDVVGEGFVGVHVCLRASKEKYPFHFRFQICWRQQRNHIYNYMRMERNWKKKTHQNLFFFTNLNFTVIIFITEIRRVEIEERIQRRIILHQFENIIFKDDSIWCNSIHRDWCLTLYRISEVCQHLIAISAAFKCQLPDQTCKKRVGWGKQMEWELYNLISLRVEVTHNHLSYRCCWGDCKWFLSSMFWTKPCSVSQVLSEARPLVLVAGGVGIQFLDQCLLWMR